MIRTVLSVLAAAGILIHSSACAAAPAKEQNNGPQINVRINPEDAKAEQAYEAAVSKLTPAQQDDLKKLDDDLAAAIAPKVDLNIFEVQYSQCATADKDFNRKYAPKMQTFRLRENDQLASRRGPFMERVKAIDYIDRPLLGHHLAYKDVLMTQLAASVAAAANQGGNKDELCAKLKKELEDKYSAAYVDPSARAVMDGETMRDGGGIKGCMFGARYNSADGNAVTTGFLFEREVISFSAKIARPDMTFLPVSDMWASFGGFDTRSGAQTGPQNQQMMAGIMQPQAIIPLLAAIRDGDVAMSASTPGAKPYVFAQAKPQPELAETLAGCAGLIAPQALQALHQAGFKAVPDPRDRKAMEEAASAPYRLIMPHGGDNPGSCVWQLRPYSETDGALIAPAFTVNGFVDEKNPSNNTATFFIQGVKSKDSPEPLAFDGLKVRIKNPADGTIIDTSELENARTIPGGKLFNISLPLGTARILVDGISKSGLEITARTADGRRTYTHSFAPPGPDAVKSYNECMAKVEKDLTARLQKTSSP